MSTNTQTGSATPLVKIVSTCGRYLREGFGLIAEDGYQPEPTEENAE